MLRVREARELHDPPLSQEGLAYAAGISVATVRTAERSGHVNVRSLVAMAEALGLEPGELFAKRNGRRRKKRAA